MERSTVMLKSLVCLILLNKILAAPTSLNDTQTNYSIDDGKNRTGIFGGEENVGSFSAKAEVTQLSQEETGKSKKNINGRKLMDSTNGKTQIHNSAYPFTFEETNLSNALISSISILKDINGDADFNVKLNQPSSNTSATIRIINHIHSGNNKMNNLKKEKESRNLTKKILNNTFDSILSKPISSDVTVDGRVVHKLKRIIPNRTLDTQTSNAEAVLSVSKKNSINVNDSDKLSIEKDSVTSPTTIIHHTGLKEDSEVTRRKGKLLNSEHLPTESESGSLKAGHDSQAASQGHVESKNSHVTHNSTNHVLNSYESLQGRSVPSKYENNKNSLIFGSNNSEDKKENLNSLGDKDSMNDSDTAGDIKRPSTEFSKDKNKYYDQINTRLSKLTLPNENKPAALERELIALNVFKKLSELNDVNENSDNNTDDDYLSIENVSRPVPRITNHSELTKIPTILTQNIDKFPTVLATKRINTNSGLRESEHNQNNVHIFKTNTIQDNRSNVTENTTKNIVGIVNIHNVNDTKDGIINSSVIGEVASVTARRRGTIKFNPGLSTPSDSGSRKDNELTLKPVNNRPVRRKIEQNNENKKEISINEEIVKGNYPNSFKQFTYSNPINKNDQESTKYKENFQKFEADQINQRDLISNTSSTPVRNKINHNIVNNTLESSNNLEIEKNHNSGIIYGNHEFNNNTDIVNQTYSEVISSNNKSPSNKSSRRRNNQNVESLIGVGIETENIPSTLHSQSNSINQNNENSSESTNDKNSSSLRSRPLRRKTVQVNENNKQESTIQIKNGSGNFTSAAKTLVQFGKKLHQSEQGRNIEIDKANVDSAAISQENVTVKNILRTRSKNSFANTKNEQNTLYSLINAEIENTNISIEKNPQSGLVNENVKNYQESNSFRRHQDKAKSFIKNVSEEETSTKNSVTPYQDNNQAGKVTKLQWIKITPPSTNAEKLDTQEANYLSRSAKTQNHSRNNPINSNENIKNIHETVTVQSAGDSKFYRIATTAATHIENVSDQLRSENNNAFSQNGAYNSESSTLSSSFKKHGNKLINNDFLKNDAEESDFLKPPKDTILSLRGKENFPILTQTTGKTLNYDKANIDLTSNQKLTSTFTGKNYLPNSNITLNNETSENIRKEDTHISKETSDHYFSSETSSNNWRKYQNIQRQNNLTTQKVSETTENQNISQSKDAYYSLNEFYLDESVKEKEDNKGNKQENGIPQTIFSVPKYIGDDTDKNVNLENKQLNINITRGGQKHTPSRFETISPFISDSHTNKIYSENTLTTAFVPTQARRKEKPPPVTTQRTEHTAPILPIIKIFPQKENRTTQRSEQQDASLRATNIKENSERKSSLRRNRGSIKYVYDSLNPDLIYGDGNYPSQFSYNYKTPTGISAYQKGELKEINEQKVFIIHGSYKYTSPDGSPVLVSYTADENGFHLQETPLIDENFQNDDVQTGSQNFYSEINKRKAKTIRAKQNQNGESGENNNSTAKAQVTEESINGADEIKFSTEVIKKPSRGRHTTSPTISTVSNKPDNVTEKINNFTENSKNISEKIIDVTENYKHITKIQQDGV